MDEEEKGQEAQEPQEEQPEPETAEAEIDLAALADELVKRFDVHLQPIAEMERQQTEQGEQIAELQSALKAFLEGQEAKVDGTRFSLSLEKRASRAKETQLDDDDELLDKKPEMTKAASGSGASHFFPEK